MRRSPWAPRRQVRACSEGRNRSRQPTSAATARPTSPARGRPAWAARTSPARPAAATSGARQARLRVQAASSSARRRRYSARAERPGRPRLPVTGSAGRRRGRGRRGPGNPEGVPRWVQGGPAAAQQLGGLAGVGVQEPLELLGVQLPHRQPVALVDGSAELVVLVLVGRGRRGRGAGACAAPFCQRPSGRRVLAGRGRGPEAGRAAPGGRWRSSRWRWWSARRSSAAQALCQSRRRPGASRRGSAPSSRPGSARWRWSAAVRRFAGRRWW